MSGTTYKITAPKPQTQTTIYITTIQQQSHPNWQPCKLTQTLRDYLPSNSLRSTDRKYITPPFHQLWHPLGEFALFSRCQLSFAADRGDVSPLPAIVTRDLFKRTSSWVMFATTPVTVCVGSISHCVYVLANRPCPIMLQNVPISQDYKSHVFHLLVSRLTPISLNEKYI